MNDIASTLVNSQKVTTNSSAQSTVTPKQLKQDDFLKLLMTQLQMQNPSDPYDSSSMLQQMAQLTSLSTSESLQSTIAKMSSSMASNQALQAAQIVGHKIQAASDAAYLVKDEGLEGGVVLSEPATNVVVNISDQSGNIVKRIDLSSKGAGTADFKWDGLKEDGSAAAPGMYQISATGLVGGETKALTTVATTKVESVTLKKDGSGILLNTNGFGSVEFKDILRIL